jgi:hypothetical protein
MAETSRLPVPGTDAWDWQLRASCRNENSSYFFHPAGERGLKKARRDARAKGGLSREDRDLRAARSTRARADAMPFRFRIPE